MDEQEQIKECQLHSEKSIFLPCLYSLFIGVNLEWVKKDFGHINKLLDNSKFEQFCSERKHF